MSAETEARLAETLAELRNIQKELNQEKSLRKKAEAKAKQDASSVEQLQR